MNDRYVSEEEKRRRRKYLQIGNIVFFSVVLYVAVSLMAYWVTHPELSQMELLFHLGNALIWRW